MIFPIGWQTKVYCWLLQSRFTICAKDSAITPTPTTEIRITCAFDKVAIILERKREPFENNKLKESIFWKYSSKQRSIKTRTPPRLTQYTRYS
jgi:hypothetical protein